MTEPWFHQLKSEVINLLRSGLSPQLTYHSVAHTEDVLWHAERIGIAEEISDQRLMLLLQTAALFHDTGFLRTYKGHEEESCRIMREMLGSDKYSTEELDTIEGMIMATKIPQSPHTLAEMIICDADLDYLGRNDFFEISDSLRIEFLTFGIISDNKQWDLLQVSFFESHRYFTSSSLQDRYPIKKQHYEILKQKLQ
ncbi:MAG TPA: HD domain-containing protein [Chitinophagaceae bacterium]|nr:HD domain-containing protein [Chitinophagaceae bacterium]